MKKFQMLFIPVSVILVVFCFCSSGLLAEDFTFNVPVELHNIPANLNKWVIRINVVDKYNQIVGSKDNYFTVPAAFGNVSKPLEFVQTIQIKFNAEPGKVPADAVHYRLVINNVQGNTWFQPAQAIPPQLVDKSKTNWFAEGDIPR
jgi:hypothetical protein